MSGASLGASSITSHRGKAFHTQFTVVVIADATGEILMNTIGRQMIELSQ